MKPFVDWLLAQRLRLILVAVVAAPLLPLVSAALMTLDTARNGSRQGALSAAAALVGLLVIAALGRADVALVGAIGGVSMFGGVFVGELLRKTRSLVFTFQLVVLACFALVLAWVAVGPDPGVVFGPLLREFEAVMQTPDYSQQDVADVTARVARMLPGVTLFSSLVGALLLGHWWWTLAEGESRFGREFRELTLGRWLGVAATLLVVLGFAGSGLVFGSALVQNLTPLAWLSFAVQGFAVIHAAAYARKWHSAALVLLYVMTAMLTVLALLGIAFLGLLDVWLNFRKRLRAA